MQTRTPCAACQVRGKTWEGGDPKCAFLDATFDGEHCWNCATANEIRDLCMRADDFRIHHCREEDQNYATISTLDIKVSPADGLGHVQKQPDCLWVGWYKQRGRTEAMWLMYDTLPPRKPTEAEVLAILKHYAKKEAC